MVSGFHFTGHRVQRMRPVDVCVRVCFRGFKTSWPNLNLFKWDRRFSIESSWRPAPSLVETSDWRMTSFGILQLQKHRGWAGYVCLIWAGVFFFCSPCWSIVWCLALKWSLWRRQPLKWDICHVWLIISHCMLCSLGKQVSGLWIWKVWNIKMCLWQYVFHVLLTL